MSEYRERLLSCVGGMEGFVSSWSNRTFSPERRAAQTIDEGEQYILHGRATVMEAGGTVEMADVWTDRFIKKWSALQAAGSRVMNWMITGPARFPVERNNKRMEVEARRRDEMLAHVSYAGEWTRRQLRKGERAALSEAAKDQEHETREENGVKLVMNRTLDRVQLIFSGRPSPEIVSELKRRAFRWSPREGAWQRQLTRNGVWAAERVFSLASPSPAGGRDE